jgi:hypothetical protein
MRWWCKLSDSLDLEIPAVLCRLRAQLPEGCDFAFAVGITGVRDSLAGSVELSDE